MDMHQSFEGTVRGLTFRVFLVILFIAPAAVPAFGQGSFLPIEIPTTAIQSGHTEVVGLIHLALRSGTTTADVLRIDPSPLQITNASGTDIQVTTAGNLATGAPTIDSTLNVLRIPISAGGSTGSIRITGLRLSIDGATALVSTQVSFEQLNVMLEQASITVVDSLSPGLRANPMTDNFTVINGQVVDSTATIPVEEAFAEAFVSGADFGQTTGTQVRIKVSDLPNGLSMSFPASVTATETTATLTTTGGAAVELRRDGTTEVSYVFSQAANSRDTLESFDISFSVSTSGPVEVLQPTIEVSLGPIGAATPTTTLPSTAIPRFAENDLLVLAGSSRTISERLYWPGIDPDLEHRLTMFNPGSQAANVTVERFDADGGIRSSTQLILAANQVRTEVIETLFPETVETPTSIRISSTEPDLRAIGNVRGNAIEENLKLTGRGGFVSNLFASGEDRVTVWNINPVATNGTLELRGSTGILLASASVSLNTMASLQTGLDELFPAVAGSYLTSRFDQPVVVTARSRSPDNLTIASPDFLIRKPMLFAPFAVSGNGYETELTIINTSDEAAIVTVNFVRDEAASSTQIPIQPGELYKKSLSDLFHPALDLGSGYLRLDLPPIHKAFFTTYTGIAAQIEVRTKDGLATTVMPLSRDPARSVTVIDFRASESHFAGIAIVNPGSTASTVSLGLLDSDGSLVEETALSVEPGGSVSRLLTEIFNRTIPTSGRVQFSSGTPFFSAAIGGATDGSTMNALLIFP